MSNMRRFYEDGVAYFATTVAGRREPIFKDRRLCRILLITLAYYKLIFDYEIYGYCIMPDHVHLIIRPNSKYDLSFIMKMVKGSFSRKINKQMETEGSIWQPSFFEEAVRNKAQLKTQLDYIHANPVKANLSSSVEGYEFSSYRQYFFPERLGEVILEVDNPL